MRSSTTRVVDTATLERLRRPRCDIVAERRGPVADTFDLETGPFHRYRRTLEVAPLDADHHEVVETFDYAIAAPVWWLLVALPLRQALRKPPAEGRMPWWSPPDRLDGRASSVLALLCCLSVVSGYLGTVIAQTITFAADEFGDNKSAQGNTLALTRIGIIVSMAIVALADRHGRRRFVVTGTAVACAVTALGALSPNLWVLGATQTVARGIVTAVAILILVIAAEELPAGSRAYGVSVLALSAALGSGMAVWALPLADVNERGWRLIYVIPLFAVPFLPLILRRLPETLRFLRAQEASTPAPSAPSGRLVLLGATAFLLLLFRTPASQLQNDFLRDERGFSGARISLFTVMTSTPAGLGVFFGGKLADRRGRRGVAAIGLVGGSVFAVASFLAHGWPMWWWAFVSMIVASLTVPALGVYGPEMFATRARGRANGLITLAGVIGSVVGLVVGGALADQWGLGKALAVLSIGPLVATAILLRRFPETAHRELEELNPDDATHAPAR
jgi:MFS family permease